MSKITDKIRILRKAAGLRQEEAASLAGLSRTEWSRMETGKRENLTLSTLERIARALKVPAADILHEESAAYHRKVIRIPIVGEAIAGWKVDVKCESALDEYSPVEIAGTTVGVEVVGKSFEPLARAGQHMLVDVELAANDGDLVCIMIVDEETKTARPGLKRIHQPTADTIVLSSVNQNRPGIEMLNIKEYQKRLLGKIVGVLY